MINEASENSLKRALEKYLIEVTEIKERYGKRFNEYRLDIKGDDFQTIKVQLRALGLIKRSIKQRSVKDTETYWTLTPYGDNVMTRLRAIKRASE
jgi:DNA-binding HxlR family transcriptional regulator